MPLPGPTLFPSPSLFPGGPGPFSDLVLEATSPWDDPDGSWTAYNTALATMFESVYDIVADRGDPERTQVATLSAPLSTSGPVTNLVVESVGPTVPSGTQITLSYAENTQLLTTRTPAQGGSSIIAITSTTPNFAYPIGTPVQLAFIPGWSTLLDPNNCPDQFLPFLAQFNGADVPIGLGAETARAKILEEGSQHRGTIGAITSAIRRNLDPNSSQDIFIQERVDAIGNSNAYWFMAIVRPSQVLSAQALKDDVNAVKPGGVQWTLIQTDGWTISQMEASEATVVALEADFATIGGLEADQPGT